mgnify:CR=1 FL=1
MAVDDQPVGYIASALHDATEDELWNKMRARYPVCIFTGLQEALGDPNATSRVMKWSGCVVSAIGLLDVSRERLLGTMHLGADADEQVD